MAKFAVALKRTLDTLKTVGTVCADASGSPRRGYLYYWSIGSESAPADNNIEFQMKRFITSAGAATGVPVTMIDPGDPLATADAAQAHTGEPSYTSNTDVFREAFNQKYGAKWYAPPGGEIIYPATGSSGLGVLTPVCTSGTPLLTVELHVEEK